MLYLGLVTGVILQTLVAERAGLPAARIYFATLTLLPIALAGSRVLYVMAHWHTFRTAPHLIWRRGEGGLAMYGGVPFMIAASIPVLAVFRLPFWTFWDTAVFCIFPGMTFARIGCLLNGCCSGRPSNGWLAMWLPDEQGQWAWRVPLQLIELSVALLLLTGAWLAIDRVTQPGRLFLGTVVGYAAARLALESMRTERERAARVDLHAAISLTLIVLALSAMYAL
jgi:phosphatidylglycerol:prolipoprotein diacylglycerol transferase